jgi:hypothetical protein
VGEAEAGEAVRFAQNYPHSSAIVRARPRRRKPVFFADHLVSPFSTKSLKSQPWSFMLLRLIQNSV